MAWKGGIDWAAKLKTPVAVNETVKKPGVNLSNLPSFVFIGGEQWWRTSALSKNRTYSYVKCPKQSVADAGVSAYDHITVSGDSTDENSYTILNAHLTYLDDDEPKAYYYPSTNTYSENPAPGQLREFVVAVFFQVVTVYK